MLVEGLRGCPPTEGLSGSGVEGRGDGGEVAAAMPGEVGALGVPLCLSSGWAGGRRIAPGGPGK